MEIKQVNEKIKEQWEIIKKAEEQVAICHKKAEEEVELYSQMQGLIDRLKEVIMGKKVVAKAPVVKKAKKKKAKKKKAKKAVAKKVNTATKDSPKKEGNVMPFVYEAMDRISQNFTSAVLLEVTLNLIWLDNAPITKKQAASAVHGYLHMAAREKIKSNPYPLTDTGKKNRQGQKIYQQTITRPKATYLK